MAGLLNSAISSGEEETDLLDSDQTLKATAIGYDAEKRDVSDDELVSEQLDKQLGEDSLLQQRAVAGATQYANSRGLVNSTMAAQAGQAAAIDAALPVAEADASTYSTAARDNQAAGNEANQFNASAENTATAQNVDTATKVALTKLDSESQLALQELKGDQATVLAEIEANYKQLMQANASASSLFNESMSEISKILGDASTSADQKSAAVAGVNALLESGLAVLGAISNLALGDLLVFA